MVDQVEKVTRVVEEPVPAAGATTEVRQVSQSSVKGNTLAARVIWYVAGILITLLAIRFLLALLGANPSNGFANFIYNVTHPFVAPFFSLFGYDLKYGVSRFEMFTLVAIAVYALVAFGLSRLTTLNSVNRDRV